MLEGYNIEFNAFSKALISALIVAKIVVLLGKTRAGTRFDAHHSLGATVLYRTMVYSGCTFLVLFAEKMFLHGTGKAFDGEIVLGEDGMYFVLPPK